MTGAPLELCPNNTPSTQKYKYKHKHKYIIRRHQQAQEQLKINANHWKLPRLGLIEHILYNVQDSPLVHFVNSSHCLLRVIQSVLLNNTTHCAGNGFAFVLRAPCGISDRHN